jgi:hypothetical protein
MRLAIAIVMVIGCGKESSSTKKETPPPTPPVAATDAAPPPAPRDSRLVPIFEAAVKQQCTWNDIGLANISCEAEAAMREVAFQGQSDPALAASCVGALRDPDPIVRGLAAHCFGQLTNVTQSPLLGAVLDAVEAEKEPNIRTAIARAAGSANAIDAKLDERVVAMTKTLAADPTGDAAASSLLGALFPSYLAQTAPKPTPASVDLVLQLVKSGPGKSTWQRAIELAPRLVDRAAEACAALVQIAASGEDDFWPRAVHSIGDLGAPCSSDALDPVIDVMVGAMQSNKYGMLEYQATTRLLERVQLTPAQNAKLEPATKQLAKQAPSTFKDQAKEVAKRCIHNRDKKLAPP